MLDEKVDEHVQFPLYLLVWSGIASCNNLF